MQDTNGFSLTTAKRAEQWKPVFCTIFLVRSPSGHSCIIPVCACKLYNS